VPPPGGCLLHDILCGHRHRDLPSGRGHAVADLPGGDHGGARDAGVGRPGGAPPRETKNHLKALPKARVHPPIDDRVETRVAHGQPMATEPQRRQPGPVAERLVQIPHDLEEHHNQKNKHCCPIPI